MKRRYLIMGIVLALVAAVALFWRFGGGPPQQAHTQSFEYRLKWLINAGFAGDVYADTYGLYLGEGLRVNVSAGGPDRDALSALLRPNSDTWFAVASADQVLKRVYQGATDLRVIAQVYSRSPVRWIYRRSLGEIRGPRDLLGRRIGVAVGDNDEALMRSYLSNNGIQESQVTLVGIQFDYEPFLSGAVDLFPVYRNTQGVELQRRLQAEGEQVAFFNPSEGPGNVQFAANSVVTTSRILAEHPDAVRAFLRATLRGWDESANLNNLDRTTRAVIQAIGSASVDEASIREQVRVTARFIKPTASHRIGAIDQNAWFQTEETLLRAGQLRDSAGRPVTIPAGQRPTSRVGVVVTDEYLPSR